MSRCQAGSALGTPRSIMTGACTAQFRVIMGGTFESRKSKLLSAKEIPIPKLFGDLCCASGQSMVNGTASFSDSKSLSFRSLNSTDADLVAGHE